VLRFAINYGCDYLIKIRLSGFFGQDWLHRAGDHQKNNKQSLEPVHPRLPLFSYLRYNRILEDQATFCRLADGAVVRENPVGFDWFSYFVGLVLLLPPSVNSADHAIHSAFRIPRQVQLFAQLDLRHPQRKHVRNGMLSPIAFEQQQKLTLQGV
jgi:hypothetical protein